jgi:hypothetical protein
VPLAPGLGFFHGHGRIADAQAIRSHAVPKRRMRTSATNVTPPRAAAIDTIAVGRHALYVADADTVDAHARRLPGGRPNVAVRPEAGSALE